MVHQGRYIENPVTGQSLRFLVTASESEGKNLQIETRFRQHSTPPPLHSHPQQHEYFRVQEGEVQVRLGDEERVLRAGEELHIAPGQPHTMWNSSGRPATVHWTTTPALRSEEFLTSIFQLAQNGSFTRKGTPPLLQSALLLHEFRNEYQLARPARWVQVLMLGVLRPVARLVGL